jgi:hypothetical protein
MGTSRGGRGLGEGRENRNGGVGRRLKFNVAKGNILRKEHSNGTVPEAHDLSPPRFAITASGELS